MDAGAIAALVVFALALVGVVAIARWLWLVARRAVRRARRRLRGRTPTGLGAEYERLVRDR